MRVGRRLLLGYFLIVGLAGFFVMRVFVNEVKPGVRQAMEATLVDSANALAALAAPDLRSGHIADGDFARALDGLAERPIDARIDSFRKTGFGYRVYVTDARGIVLYDSRHRDVGKDYSRWNDVYLTLRGQYGARSTRDDPNDDASSVMYVAAPIRDGNRTIGVLTVGKPNRQTAPFIAASQWAILKQGWLLLGLSALIGALVTWWLSRSIQRLTGYARDVAAGQRVAPPDVGGGELGELGQSLHTMREKLEGKQYVEQYVQTLAHEMKSPLAALRGAAEILQGDPPPAERARFLRHVDDQSARLAQMLDKMLALAAVEHRQALTAPEPVDLAALGRDLAADLEPALARKSLRLIASLPDAPATVRGDRFLLRQALNNLLDNAIAFSPAGGVIGLSLARDGAQWRFEVRDQGAGIPDYALDRVFERFYSLPRPDGARSSGLGLSFVREVAALHGGEVTLRNGEQGGAVGCLFVGSAA